MLTDADYDAVMTRLSEIDDPELGVNIVDLGLIYDLYLTADGKRLVISMTLTYAGCPLTEYIEAAVHDALTGLPFEAAITWVWSPAWSMAKVSDEGRDQLRALGVSVDAVHAALGA